LNIDCVSYRRTIGSNAGTKPKREEHVAELSIVSAIGRRIEAEELGGALLVDIEIRDEVITLQ
jgi:hypothetical protein